MFHVIFFPQKYLNRILIYSVFFVLSSIASSHGQTVHNYGQWKNLSSTTKSNYVAGMMDTLLNPVCFDCKDQVKGELLKVCLLELSIVLPEIVAMLDNFYLNKNNWSHNPQEALQYQLVNGHCHQHFNSRN